jgi:hypothetical protein
MRETLSTNSRNPGYSFWRPDCHPFYAKPWYCGNLSLGVTLHASTPSAADALFSKTFSLCSGDFEVSLAFSSSGLSV